MNPGSEHQPPNTPYQVPGRPFEPQGHQVPGRPFEPQGPPPTVPTVPYMPPPQGPPPPPRRSSWLLPTLAAALVVLVAAGGVGAYAVYGKVSGSLFPAKTGQPSSSQPPAGAAKGPDVCAMLPKEEVDRLVPEATVTKSSRQSDATVTFSCNWVNRNISFGEFRREREIDVRIEQWKPEGAKTGRSLAQGSYEIDYGSGKYGETAKPTLDPGEKMYVSPVKDIPGVGDGAFAQYTWSRDKKLMWFAYGKAHARVGDMTIELKYQADQQRKDAPFLSNDTTQAITEENAIREVSGLIAYFAKGAAAWQAKNPHVLAQPEPSQSASATSAPPEPSPSVLPSFPADCTALTEVATRLVPDPETRARGTTIGADSQTECRWLNKNLPGGDGTIKIRSALITVHRFTNRAGGVDEASAKGYYASQRGSDHQMAQASMGGITWGKVADVDGLGEQAYRQFVQTRGRGEVSASSGSVLMRKGAVVVRVDYSGHQRPEGEPTNSPKVELMTEKDALGGALTLARAYMAELDKQPAGG